MMWKWRLSTKAAINRCYRLLVGCQCPMLDFGVVRCCAVSSMFPPALKDPAKRCFFRSVDRRNP